MNRNETWNAADVSVLSVQLAWATLELMADEVSAIQMIVAGDDMDVQDLHAELKEGRLTIEQPAYGLTHRINVVRWMQVTLRVPRDWMGTLQASTIAGQLTARGLSAAEQQVDTVSGDLRVQGLTAKTLSLRTVTGRLLAEALTAEKAGLRTVSGEVTARGCAFSAMKLSTVSADAAVEPGPRVQRLEASSVSGDIRVTLEADTANITLRGATGKLRTKGVSIGDEGPEISVTTVSGSLFVSRPEA